MSLARQSDGPSGTFSTSAIVCHVPPVAAEPDGSCGFNGDIDTIQATGDRPAGAKQTMAVRKSAVERSRSQNPHRQASLTVYAVGGHSKLRQSLFCVAVKLANAINPTGVLSRGHIAVQRS